MRKTPSKNPGTVHRLTIDSECLKGNAVGDPARRELIVYTPPNYDSKQKYPLFVDLVGYTGSGQSHANWKNFGYNLPERLDHLIAGGTMGPVIAAMPDCFTCYGGNQYINSVGTGRYMDYLCDEAIPLVEREFACFGDRDHRAVFGKSSGGYGAFIHGMTRADFWGAAASHSGDAGHDHCHFPYLFKALDVLQKHEESIPKFLESVWAKEKLEGAETECLMALGMAAHYDPDPANPGVARLPLDLHTGRIIPERWANWMAADPAVVVEQAEAQANLRRLKGFYFDCGRKDQFGLLYGNRQIHRTLEQAGIPHRYEEFDDNHSDVDYRMEISLPWLYQALMG